MITYAGNLKRGEFINHQGSIWQVQKADFYSPGKGSALMHCKIKNVATGKTLDYAFKANENVETVEVNAIEMQYMYKDSDTMYFMNEKTYDQVAVPLAMAEEFIQFVKDGDKLYVFMHDDKALSVRAPLTVRLKIVETEDAVKGDTVSGAKKIAKLETGATVMVPLFIKPGEVIVVNPDSGRYVERA